MLRLCQILPRSKCMTWQQDENNLLLHFCWLMSRFKPQHDTFFFFPSFSAKRRPCHRFSFTVRNLLITLLTQWACEKPTTALSDERRKGGLCWKVCASKSARGQNRKEHSVKGKHAEYKVSKEIFFFPALCFTEGPTEADTLKLNCR